MALIHCGTPTTLATIPVADPSNGDTSYIFYNLRSHLMEFNSTATDATDLTKRPISLRPDDYATGGVWIEDMGTTSEADAWNGYQIVTGRIQSINWAATAGSEYDLDLATITLGGSNVDYNGSAAGVFLGLHSSDYKVYIGDGAGSHFKYDAVSGVVIVGNLTATTGTIGGWTLTATELHNTNLWLDAADKQIAINSQTFGNDGIQLEYNSGNPRAYVGDGANAYFQFDGTKVQWKGSNSELDSSGNIVCTGGTIGGFTLAATTLTATNLLLDAGNQEIKLGTGNDIISLDAADADYRLAIGHATYGSAPFRVTKAGVLTATGATITGTITATLGAIGGWSIDGTSIYTGVEDHSGYTANAGDITIYSDGANASIHAKSFYIDSSGVLTATGVTVTGTVTSAALTATAGTIGGFTINATEGLYAGADATRVQMKAGAGFWAGATAFGGAPFRVSEAGALVATSATITGAITATSGAIGGFTLNADHLYTGAKTAYDDANAGVHLGTDGIGFGDNVFTVSDAGALVATSATISGAISAAIIDIGGDDATSFHVDIDGGIWSGAAIADKATAPFRVSNAGALVATSATITGAITATSGSFIGAISGSTIDIGGADATSFHVDVDGNVWAGAAAYNIATNPFAVSNAGAMRAGGFAINATDGIYSGAAATRVQIKPGAAGVGGIWTGATAVGDAKNYLDVDGSGKLADGRISWTAAGVLTTTLNSGGSLTLDAGADIILTGHDSDPGIISFTGSSYNVEMGLNAAGTTFSIAPTTTGVTDLNLGDGTPYYFDQAYIYAKTNSFLIAKWSSTEFASIKISSDSGTDPYMVFDLQNAGYNHEVNFVSTSDPSARLTRGSRDVDLGSAGLPWTNVYADVSYTIADNGWIGLGAAAGRIEFDDQATDEINFLDCNVGIGTSTPSVNADLTLEGGALCIKERATPTADTNYGKIYTKNDNKLYFQDGAGAEHTVAFV